MTQLRRKIPYAISVATLSMLAACGGGGGGDVTPAASGGGEVVVPPVSGGDTPTQVSAITGTVATGAPLEGAAVTIVDRTGDIICAVKTNAEGTYHCPMPAQVKLPLVVKAVLGNISIFSAVASGQYGVVNVTPVTSIIVAQLSPDGDPLTLADRLEVHFGVVTTAEILNKVAALANAMRPLLDALQVTFDPMFGPFKADGTGQDLLLDTINVSVTPNGVNSTVDITVKEVPVSPGTPPPSISFKTGSEVTIQPFREIRKADLVAPPTPGMIPSFLERLNACYALPVNQRVNTPVQPDGNAFGTAENVVAPECRTLFLNDNPSTFVSASGPVGRSSTGASTVFTSLFRAGPTNLKHDRGNFEYFQSNGDITLSYRWTDSYGNTDNDLFIARNVDGQLKLTANDQQYRAGVRSFLEVKDFLKHQNLIFNAVGYSFSVDARRDQQGNPTISKVRLTSEALPGTTLFLVPKVGSSTMVLSSDGTIEKALNSASWRMSAKYLDPAKSGTPDEFDSGALYAAPYFSDDKISALPEQTVWKLEFFSVNSQDQSVPSAVQYVRTVSRAPTIAEAKLTPTIDLVPSMRAELLEFTKNTARGAVFGTAVLNPATPDDANNVQLSQNGNEPAWAVPAGALAPTLLTISGRASGADGLRFNDTQLLRSTDRTAFVTCQPIGQNDPHCAPLYVNQWQYATGSSVNTFSFSARTQRLVDIRKNFEVWTVTLPTTPAPVGAPAGS